jgi:hypothetical protein
MNEQMNERMDVSGLLIRLYVVLVSLGPLDRFWEDTGISAFDIFCHKHSKICRSGSNSSAYPGTRHASKKCRWWFFWLKIIFSLLFFGHIYCFLMLYSKYCYLFLKNKVTRVARMLAGRPMELELEQKGCTVMALLDGGMLRRHKSWLKVLHILIIIFQVSWLWCYQIDASSS